MDQMHATHAPGGPACDIYLAYADADEDVAKALQAELFRLRPGTRIWREKYRIGAGDAFNQTADTAIADAGLVIALWTPHSTRTRAFAVETRRAMTLRKPFINLLAGTGSGALPPPHPKYATFDVTSIQQLAGRSTGWLPPMRPSRSEIEADLNPVIAKIDELLDLDRSAASQIADSMITQIGESVDAPHTPQFEAVLKSVAIGDPATAIEILGISGYSEAEINTLIAPQVVELADPAAPPPPWGAWRIVPQIVKVQAAPDDNLLFAAAGFVAAALGAGILWLMASMFGGDEATPPPIITTGTSTIQPASTSSGSTQIDARLDACSVETDGAITNAPCRVETNLLAPLNPGTAPTTLVPCDVGPDGAITNTPCAMNARYTPPPPDPTRFSDLIETCQVAEDGAVANAPCALNEPLTAPTNPEPDLASLIDTCDVADDGAITNAPCRVITPIAAPEPRTVEVEVPGETVVERVYEQVTVDDCAPARAGQTVPADCRLTRDITLAYPPCNAGFSNIPCTATQEPRRITSAIDTTPPPVDLPPIRVPADLEPCEVARAAPCRVTVAKTGLDTLTQIAEHYYGNADGYCRIFRANEDLFGTRQNPKRTGDPNCIYLDDVISVPGPPSNGRFTPAACPSAQATNLCSAPR
ncbi:MAG: TIR domain-containing protein [Pseudomonadota bacterium]